MCHTFAHLSPLTRPNRAFMEAFIVQRDIDIPMINAYADTLANTHWTGDRPTRLLLMVAMTALIDGWLDGYEDGYNAGVDEGKAIVTLGLRDIGEGAR